MSEPMPNELNVVIFRDGGFFIASVVEFDIMAQGKTQEEALNRLRVTLNCETRDRDGNLSEIGPAPDVIHEMFEGPDSRVVARELLAA